MGWTYFLFSQTPAWCHKSWFSNCSQVLSQVLPGPRYSWVDSNPHGHRYNIGFDCHKIINFYTITTTENYCKIAPILWALLFNCFYGSSPIRCNCLLRSKLCVFLIVNWFVGRCAFPASSGVIGKIFWWAMVLTGNRLMPRRNRNWSRKRQIPVTEKRTQWTQVRGTSGSHHVTQLRERYLDWWNHKRVLQSCERHIVHLHFNDLRQLIKEIHLDILVKMIEPWTLLTKDVPAPSTGRGHLLIMPGSWGSGWRRIYPSSGFLAIPTSKGVSREELATPPYPATSTASRPPSMCVRACAELWVQLG